MLKISGSLLIVKISDNAPSCCGNVTGCLGFIFTRAAGLEPESPLQVFVGSRKLQGLSQDFETGCLKLTIVKYFGFLFFKGGHNTLRLQL